MHVSDSHSCVHINIRRNDAITRVLNLNINRFKCLAWGLIIINCWDEGGEMEAAFFNHFLFHLEDPQEHFHPSIIYTAYPFEGLRAGANPRTGRQMPLTPELAWCIRHQALITKNSLDISQVYGNACSFGDTCIRFVCFFIFASVTCSWIHPLLLSGNPAEDLLLSSHMGSLGYYPEFLQGGWKRKSGALGSVHVWKQKYLVGQFRVSDWPNPNLYVFGL